MLIVGIGGTLRTGSSTERAVSHILRNAQSLGASTEIFIGESLNLPMYVPNQESRCERAVTMASAP